MANILVGTNDLILSHIFGFCGECELKNCRLVNTQWLRNATSRTRVVLRVGNSQARNLLLRNATWKNLTPFRNVRVAAMESPVRSLLLHHFESVRCLCLVKVVFESVKEFESVLFYTFPNLAELQLYGLEIRESTTTSDKNLHEGTDAEKKEPVNFTCMRKLEVCLNGPYVLKPYGSHEAVTKVGLTQILKRFPKIKEFAYCCDSNTESLDVFDSLLCAKTELEKLSLDINCSRFPGESSRAYLQKYGRNIYSFMSKGVNRNIFGDHGSSSSSSSSNVELLMNLRSLTLRRMDANAFGNGTFGKLTYLDLTCLPTKTLKFLDAMPHLRNVRLGFMIGASCSDTDSTCGMKQCLLVEKLGYHYSTLSFEEEMFRKFPNVRTLTLDGCSSGEFCSFMANACTYWPRLTCLHVIHLYSGAYDRCRFLRMIADSLLDLEAFSYLGDVFSNSSVREILRLPKLRKLDLDWLVVSENMLEELQHRVSVLSMKGYTLVDADNS